MPRQYTPRVHRVCLICGTAFQVTPSVLRKGHGNFCTVPCANRARGGELSPHWRGGVQNSGSDRYVRVYVGQAKHPRLAHRVVMEQHLGRPLRRNEIVHHRDGNGKNNDIANLEVMSQADHVRLHKPRLKVR